jgi:Flp pilus assembly protein TadD
MYRWFYTFMVIALFLSLISSGCTQTVQSGANPQTVKRVEPTVEVKERSDLPPTSKTLYSMAEILAVQGRDSESEFILKQCIAEYPDFTPAYNALAELQMRQGRINQAINTLNRGMEVGPRDPIIMNNLGMCYLIREDYPKALDLFTQAAGILPEKTRYRANMAVVLSFMRRDEEALALYMQILPENSAEKNLQIIKESRENKRGLTSSLSK